MKKITELKLDYQLYSDTELIIFLEGKVNELIDSVNKKEVVVKTKNTSDILGDPEFINELATKFPGIEASVLTDELEKMRDWLAANGKVKKDYKAFARNWLRNVKPKDEKLSYIKII